MATLSKHFPSVCLTLLGLALVISPLGAQAGVDASIQLALEGKVDRAAANLAQLQAQHPNSGSLLYLQALVKSDGDEAVSLYRLLIQLHPNSPYADDAMLKVGEYLYARGLYTQSAQQLKQIPVHYPRSDLIYPSIRMFLNAMLVSGKKDTARFYAQVFSRKYPDIVFDLKSGRAVSIPRELQTGSASRATARRVVEARPTGRQPEVARLQLGAFSDRANANKLMRQLKALNYQVRIDKRRNMYVVTAVGFISESEARTAGQRLKENYGMDFLVVKAP